MGLAELVGEKSTGRHRLRGGLALVALDGGRMDELTYIDSKRLSVHKRRQTVSMRCVLCVCILMLRRQRAVGHVVRHRIGSFIARGK